MNNASREQRIKQMTRQNRLREEQLIRESEKKHREIQRNSQKKQLEIIREAQRRKQELLRKNIEREKREEEIMRGNIRKQNEALKNNNRIHNDYLSILPQIHISQRRRSEDTQYRERQIISNYLRRRTNQNNNDRLIANIIRANNIRRNNNLNRNGPYGQSDEDIINNFVRDLIRNIPVQNITNNNNRNNNNDRNNERVRLNNESNKDNKKIEELLQETELTEQIMNKLDNKQCLICLDNYLVGEKVSYLPCFHLFHYLCIKSWVARSNKCPLCKNIIKFE